MQLTDAQTTRREHCLFCCQIEIQECRMRLFDRRILTAGLALALGAGAVGCESNTGSGALIGGAAGAGLGGLIGSYSHARAGEGALIGGAIGAASGALIGNAADQQERDAYRRQSEWRYEDYPVESREYR